MDDVLNCQLINVDGRIYRYSGSTRIKHIVNNSRPAIHQAASASDTGCEPEEEQLDESDIQEQGGQYYAKIYLDTEVYPFIIGKGGSSKKQIEQATGATLIIPRRDEGVNAITIKASTKLAVARGRQRTLHKIQTAIAGKLLDFTHFVSLPLLHSNIELHVNAFKQQVLADGAAAELMGLEESLFVDPQRLHITVAMLKLYSDEARHTAKQALQQVAPQLQALLQDGPLQVHLKGLSIMNDDAAAAHVVYLQVHEVGPGRRVHQACELVHAALKAAGLLHETRPLKLHATLINTRHRKPKGGDLPTGIRQARYDRQPVDARQLLDSFSGLDIGRVVLPELHLSQRRVYDDATGYYAALHKLQLSS